MHLLPIGSEGVYITRDDMFTVIIFSLVEGTKKTTVTVDRGLDQTTSGAPQPAGNTGTTSQPSTPTKAGLPAAETLNSIAETTAQQTTPTPTSSPTTTPVPRPTTTPAPRSTTSSASTTTTIIMMTMTSASQPKSFLVRQSSKRLQMEHVYFSLLYTKTCTLFETHRPLMLTYSSLTLFYSIL